MTQICFIVVLITFSEYRLEALRPGTYHLKASFAHMHFEEVTATIAPDTAALPVMTVSHYDVCGRFELDAGLASKSRVVAVDADGQTTTAYVAAVFALSMLIIV